MITVSQDCLSGPDLYEALWKAYRSIERLDRQGIERLGIGCLSDFAVLEALRDEGTLSVSSLGARVLLTSGSITTAVDRLRKRGWVEKQRNLTDRRGVVVSLTDAGRQLINQAGEGHHVNFERVFSVLDAADRRKLHELLHRVWRHAEQLD